MQRGEHQRRMTSYETYANGGMSSKSPFRDQAVPSLDDIVTNFKAHNRHASEAFETTPRDCQPPEADRATVEKQVFGVITYSPTVNRGGAPGHSGPSYVLGDHQTESQTDSQQRRVAAHNFTFMRSYCDEQSADTNSLGFVCIDKIQAQYQQQLLSSPYKDGQSPQRGRLMSIQSSHNTSMSKKSSASPRKKAKANLENEDPENRGTGHFVGMKEKRQTQYDGKVGPIEHMMNKANLKEYEAEQVSPPKHNGDRRGDPRLNSKKQRSSSKQSRSPYKDHYDNYDTAASAQAFSQQQPPRVIEYAADLDTADPSLQSGEQLEEASPSPTKFSRFCKIDPQEMQNPFKPAKRHFGGSKKKSAKLKVRQTQTYMRSHQEKKDYLKAPCETPRVIQREVDAKGSNPDGLEESPDNIVKKLIKKTANSRQIFEMQLQRQLSEDLANLRMSRSFVYPQEPAEEPAPIDLCSVVPKKAGEGRPRRSKSDRKNSVLKTRGGKPAKPPGQIPAQREVAPPAVIQQSLQNPEIMEAYGTNPRSEASITFSEIQRRVLKIEEDDLELKHDLDNLQIPGIPGPHGRSLESGASTSTAFLLQKYAQMMQCGQSQEEAMSEMEPVQQQNIPVREREHLVRPQAADNTDPAEDLDRGASPVVLCSYNTSQSGHAERREHYVRLSEANKGSNSCQWDHQNFYEQELGKLRGDLQELQDAEEELLLLRQEGDPIQSESNDGTEEQVLLQQSLLDDKCGSPDDFLGKDLQSKSEIAHQVGSGLFSNKKDFVEILEHVPTLVDSAQMSPFMDSERREEGLDGPVPMASPPLRMRNHYQIDERPVHQVQSTEQMLLHLASAQDHIEQEGSLQSDSIASPPTKEMSYRNLGYFDQIKLINPIKIGRNGVDQASQSDSLAGYGEEEEESSDDEFKLALKPMGLNNMCSPEVDGEAGSPFSMPTRPYPQEPRAFELGESQDEGSDDFVLRPDVLPQPERSSAGARYDREKISARKSAPRVMEQDFRDPRCAQGLMAVANQFDAINVASPPDFQAGTAGEYLYQMHVRLDTVHERQEVTQFDDQSVASSQQRSETETTWTGMASGRLGKKERRSRKSRSTSTSNAQSKVRSRKEKPGDQRSVMEKTAGARSHFEVNGQTEIEKAGSPSKQLECDIGAPLRSFDAAASAEELAPRWLPVGSACGSPAIVLSQGPISAVFLHRGSQPMVGAQAPPSQGMFDDRFDHTEEVTDGADESRSPYQRSRGATCVLLSGQTSEACSTPRQADILISFRDRQDTIFPQHRAGSPTQILDCVTSKTPVDSPELNLQHLNQQFNRLLSPPTAPANMHAEVLSSRSSMVNTNVLRQQQEPMMDSDEDMLSAANDEQSEPRSMGQNQLRTAERISLFPLQQRPKTVKPERAGPPAPSARTAVTPANGYIFGAYDYDQAASMKTLRQQVIERAETMLKEQLEKQVKSAMLPYDHEGPSPSISPSPGRPQLVHETSFSSELHGGRQKRRVESIISSISAPRQSQARQEGHFISQTSYQSSSINTMHQRSFYNEERNEPLDMFEAAREMPDHLAKMAFDPAMQPTNEANLRQYINVFRRDSEDEEGQRCPLQTQQLYPPSGMCSARSIASSQSDTSERAAGNGRQNKALHVVTRMEEMAQITENVKMKMKDKYKQPEGVTPSDKVFTYSSSSQFHPPNQPQPSSFAKRKATAPPPSQYQQASLVGPRGAVADFEGDGPKHFKQVEDLRSKSGSKIGCGLYRMRSSLQIPTVPKGLQTQEVTAEVSTCRGNARNQFQKTTTLVASQSQQELATNVARGDQGRAGFNQTTYLPTVTGSAKQQYKRAAKTPFDQTRRSEVLPACQKGKLAQPAAAPQPYPTPTLYKSQSNQSFRTGSQLERSGRKPNPYLKYLKPTTSSSVASGQGTGHCHDSNPSSNKTPTKRRFNAVRKSQIKQRKQEKKEISSKKIQVLGQY